MWSNEYNSDSEADEEVEEIDKNFKPTFVAIAIDTHPLMFRKREDQSIPFKDCLSACHSLADSLLLSSSRRSFNQFAVLVAREESPCITEFRDNLISTTKLLKSKATSPDKQLTDEYQRKGDFDLAAFFLACKKVFHDIKSPFYKRTLIYITDDDDPVPDTAKKFTALNEIKTFSGNQIEFQVIPTTPSFDYNKFYNELFSLLDKPPLEEICEDREGLIEKLTSAVVMRERRRKILFYPFKNDTFRSLNCYKLDFIHGSTLNNSKLTRDGKSVKLVAVENGDEYVDEIFYFKCKAAGRDAIKFDSYEKSSILDNSIPLGLTLLYVSKRATDVGFVLSKPFILSPKEKEDEYFKKFWQCCVKKDKVLVCAFKQKAMDKIRYVELIPFTLNSNSSVFLAKYIPFSNEIVPPKRNDYPVHVPNKKKKEAIQKMVDSLTFDFDVKMIPDPCYRKKKEYVKAKLLEEPMEEVTDVTFNTKALDEHLKEAVDMIYKNFVLVEERKRKAVSGTSRAKKAK